MKICKEVDLKDLCSNMEDDGDYYTEVKENGEYLEINKKTRKIVRCGFSGVIMFWLMTGVAEKH